MEERLKSKSTRRLFIKTAALGLLAHRVSGETLQTTQKNKSGFTVFDKSSRIDIGDRAEAMIQKAYDLGFHYEKEHRGCARCTIAALQDAIDFVPADEGLFRAASCLDGGATPTNLASCGAFTGSGMLIGWLCGTGRFGDNSLSHDLIHKVHQSFVNEYGSVICKKVRESSGRNCPEVVANSCKWTAEAILKQFTNYE